jgi:GNAT superfamily N-acetyltransferase
MTRTKARSAVPDRPVPRVEDDPADADIAVVDDALAAFTVDAAGHDEPRPLAVFARRGDTVIAGVHGATWGGCCELVSLWVGEQMRGRGLGRALLTAAEDRARARGCHQVVLFTHGFQTPDLYTSSGYDLVGQVEDYPAGSAAYWFRKRLDRTPTTKRTRISEATLWAGVAGLLLAEAIDGIRTLRRRTTYRLTDGLARIERREQRAARHVQIVQLAALAARTNRRRVAQTHPRPAWTAPASVRP